MCSFLVKLKNNFIGLSIFAISVYILMMFLHIDRTYPRKLFTSSVKLSNVIVHIDLKGTPLQLFYLESLFPMMKRYGVNGILMEYEDMFPYEGKLRNLSADYHYDKAELKRFLQSAKTSGLEIIPLVQTFGHLEFALKLAEFQHLREDPLYPDSLCPSKMESLVFLHEMMKQIIDFHKAVSPLKYIHIGCDEVYHIYQCKQCRERPEIISKQNLLIQHVRTVSEFVNSLSLETTVLIWDDMLRGIKPYEWVDIEPFPNVQPVCWDYGRTLRIQNTHLYSYKTKFSHIWIASAYKGADGRTSPIPNFKDRFRNHFQWMNFILGYRFGDEDTPYNFEGIILTGWSRYSHMDPPCELLPVAIPSLILNLLVVQKFKSGFPYTKTKIKTDSIESFFHDHVNIEFKKNFECSLTYDFLDFIECKFNGLDLYSLTQQYIFINNEITLNLVNEDDSIVSIEYFSKLGTINMNNVQQNKRYLEMQLRNLMQIENETVTIISKYYHNNFALEYVDYKLFQNKNKIMKLLNILNNYTSVRTWNRRTQSNILNLSVIQNTLK